ncbi:Six-hairpin glycosidase [Amylostereum chailletii]|nr:Six-hairpin glycosidase [Amylostereum chailletii]
MALIRRSVMSGAAAQLYGPPYDERSPNALVNKSLVIETFFASAQSRYAAPSKVLIYQLIIHQSSPSLSMLPSLSFVLFPASLAWAAAPAGPWDEFNYAPESRTVYPTAIYRVHGTVENASDLAGNQGSATLSGNNSYVTLDFGKEVGGLVSWNFENVTSSSAVSLSFTESPLFVRPYASDDAGSSAENMTVDGVEPVLAPLPTGFWTQPVQWLRGGFRYLTIVSNSDDPTTISNVSCAISFMPHFDNLRNYSGYFYAADPGSEDEDFLTKLWYAGAYTVQTNAIPVDQGRLLPSPDHGWANNATIGIASPVLVDGAKRDRTIWPGDMGISTPTSFVSLNDLIPTKNSLLSLFSWQAASGQLPFSGPTINARGSATYHEWTMIGVHSTWLYTGDIDLVQTLWANYTKAVGYLESLVGNAGLINSTAAPADWGRSNGGGYSISPNAAYYKVLLNSVELANALNQTDLAAAWAANATTLKANFNKVLWMDDVGMYRDNESTTLIPQDGNSLALLFNLTTSPAQKESISEGLTKNWVELGAVGPEMPDTVAPFVSGFEIQAHFEAGRGERALDLIRREWGYMLTTNLSVQSTLLEGYTANGSLGYRWYAGYDSDDSYTSHAHGWSTGPTSALTFYVLGLTVTSPQGATWAVSPHLSGLPAAQGGFSTGLGWFGVRWSSNETVFELDVDVPTGTKGVATLPVSGTTTVDGEAATGNGTPLLQRFFYE